MAPRPSRLRASLRISRPEAFGSLTSPVSGNGSGLYTTRAWHEPAWTAYDTVPESHATTAFIAACLSRLKFKLAYLGDDDEPGDVWDEKGNVKEGINPVAAELGRQLVRSLRAKRGGSTRFLAKIGANMAQVGDLSVVPREMNGRRYFDAYSVDELKPNGDGTWTLWKGPGRQGEMFGKTADGKPPLVIRIHREHPRYQEWSDSGVRALLPTLEIMQLLTQEMRSSTVSRIMGKGILLISDDAELPPDPNDPDKEGLTAQLATVGAVAIREPGSAAAQVPIIVRVPGKPAEMFQLIQFASPDQNTIEKRDAAVNTFARGAELPVEQVIGMAKANHWGAWMIDETTAKVYIAPLMEIIDGILTDDYLLPSLANPKLKLSPEAYANFVIHYDDAALVVHPDRSSAAQEAHGTSADPNLAISDQAYRDARGFSEDDAPNEAEIERRLAIAERLRRSASRQQPGSEGGPGSVQPGPPKTAPAAAAVSPNAGTEAEMLTRIAAAVEVAAERAVDRLGARLRSKVDASNGTLPANLKASIAGKPSREVPLLLGASVIAALIPPDQQFVGEFVALERTVARWMPGNPAAARAARSVSAAAETLARALSETPEARIDPVSLAACIRES